MWCKQSHGEDLSALHKMINDSPILNIKMYEGMIVQCLIGFIFYHCNPQVLFDDDRSFVMQHWIILYHQIIFLNSQSDACFIDWHAALLKRMRSLVIGKRATFQFVVIFSNTSQAFSCIIISHEMLLKHCCSKNLPVPNEELWRSCRHIFCCMHGWSRPNPSFLAPSPTCT